MSSEYDETIATGALSPAEYVERMHIWNAINSRAAMNPDAYLDGYADGFRAGWRSAEATRATVSPAAPDLDSSAPPTARGPQRKPWLTGAQADAAIRERRGLAGACDRLMRGFAEGDR